MSTYLLIGLIIWLILLVVGVVGAKKSNIVTTEEDILVYLIGSAAISACWGIGLPFVVVVLGIGYTFSLLADWLNKGKS